MSVLRKINGIEMWVEKENNPAPATSTMLMVLESDAKKPVVSTGHSKAGAGRSDKETKENSSSSNSTAPVVKNKYFSGTWATNDDGYAGKVYVEFDEDKQKATVFSMVEKGLFSGAKVKFKMNAKEGAESSISDADMPNLSGTMYRHNVSFERSKKIAGDEDDLLRGTFAATGFLVGLKGKWKVRPTTKERVSPRTWETNRCTIM